MRIPIRAKLTAALAVPMVALVGVAAYEAVDAAEAADAADAETQLAVAALGPGSLVSQLQIERNWSGVDQIGMGMDRPVVVDEVDVLGRRIGRRHPPIEAPQGEAVEVRAGRA